jgi:hypothetical protein
MSAFTIREAFTLGWERAKPRLGDLVLVALAYLAAVAGLTLLDLLLSKPMPMLGLLIQLINAIIVGPIMVLGLLRAGLKTFDGQAPAPGDLFSEAQHLTRYWVAALALILPLLPLAALAGVAAAMGIALAGKGGGVMLLGGLSLGLLATPAGAAAVAVYLRLAYSSYFIIDRGLEGWAAVKASWAATRGHVWRLAGLLLALLALNILGACALLLGLLITLPITLVASACVYRRLESDLAARLAQGS